MTSTRQWPFAMCVAALLLSFDARSAPVPPIEPEAPPAETIDISTSSAISFGGVVSDHFGIEEARAPDTVVALVMPLSEDCTLRFPVTVGETLRLRASSDDGKRAMCEIALVAVVNASTARFAYACQDEAWIDDGPKCPAHPEIAPESVTAVK